MNVLSDDDDAQRIWKFLLSQAETRNQIVKFNGAFLIGKDGTVLIPTDVEVEIEGLV